MTVLHYINEHQSDIRAIKRITQARGNFGASPWLARATARNGFRPSPWLRTIKCPACGDEHIRPCIRVDEGGRELIDNSCETCGHKLSLEEISRYVRH